jgi:transposase
MPKARRKFDKEFKIEAVNMVKNDGLSQAAAARRLGINDNLIGRWFRELANDPAQAFPGKGTLQPRDEEMRQLQKQIRELQMENEFLKKSAAYFASLKK